MVDISVLKSKKITAGEYKKTFTANPEDYPDPIKKLVKLLRDRSYDGYKNSFQEWQAYHAIDLAYDVPFKQTTPTLVHNILSKRLSEKETLDELEKIGLREDEMYLEVELENGRKGRVLNPPIFFNIFIPIVKAYTSIIEANLFNQRNQIPILPVNPLKDTQENTILAQIWSDIINAVGTNYGYSAVMRQSIHQTLKYGLTIAFPREEWHCEQQIVDLQDGKGPRKITVKEGLRYILPHPTRMFWDLNYPLTSLNSDSGTEFAGHWVVARYGDILDNRKYWNRRAIFPGTNWFNEPLAGNYFKEVYPCTLNFPVLNTDTMQREGRAVIYNSQSDRDKACFVCDQFAKIVPRQWGLGDYDYPVWHRFTMAGENTVIWAQPSAYNPMWFMGYDYDENAARSSSLSLELIPWQDHIGNILTQMLLTAKQNLANVIFYDQKVVDKNDIAKLTNMGERKYRGMNFIGFDSLKFAAQRVDMDKVFHNVQFNRQSIQEFIQMMPLLLNVMERVLQISAQMAGSSATHQQSKQEVVMTGQAAQSRTIFTGSLIDEGLDAWTRQNHDACLAYMDADFSAQISSEIDGLEQYVQELGLKIDSRSDRNKKVQISGKKHKLRMETFATGSRGQDPQHDRELMQIIFQTVGMVAQQPSIAQGIDPNALVTLLERAAIFGGAPKDFKLPRIQGKGPQVPPAIMAALQQAQQATLQTIEQKMIQPMAKHASETDQKLEQVTQTLQQLQGIYKIAQSNNDRLQVEAAKAKQEMQLKEAEFQQEQRRKDQELSAKLQRENKAAGARINIDKAKAAAQVHIDATTAAKETEQHQQEAPYQKLVESINYKDTPPDIQRQLEEKAGLSPAPDSQRMSKPEEVKAKTKPKPAAKPAAKPKPK